MKMGSRESEERKRETFFVFGFFECDKEKNESFGFFLLVFFFETRSLFFRGGLSFSYK